jgi:hypothetical protein
MRETANASVDWMHHVPFVQLARNHQRGCGKRRSKRHTFSQIVHQPLILGNTAREETRQNLRGGARHVGAELEYGLPLLTRVSVE